MPELRAIYQLRFKNPYLATCVLLLASSFGCQAGNGDEQEVLSDQVATKMSRDERLERVALIRRIAAENCIDNAWLIAGIAESETRMVHCVSEGSPVCSGPLSPDCGGRAVAAGYWDGTASNRCGEKQGGLGMWQFDSGTHAETLRAYGADVLTLEGSTQMAVDYVLDRILKPSAYIADVGTPQKARRWFYDFQSASYDAYIKSVVRYYNGCVQGRCGAYNERYTSYDEGMQRILELVPLKQWRLTGDQLVACQDQIGLTHEELEQRLDEEAFAN